MSEAGSRLLLLAEQLGAQLRQRHYILVSAESCTAGGVAYAMGNEGTITRLVLYAAPP